MKILLHIAFYCLLATTTFSQQRLEKEKKYLIADGDTELNSQILDALFSDGAAFVKNSSISSQSSIEQFTDEYFETTANQLHDQQLSLRYRERRQSNNQEKKLVQFKGKLSSSSDIQFEYKFDVPELPDRNDIYGRHPLLGYVDKDDRERLTFELSRFDVIAEKLNATFKIRQQRQRWYLTDSIGDLLTISLDQVRLMNIPYHRFTELEIEINENRYTSGNINERAYLDAKQKEVVNLIEAEMSSMVVDQRSKYEKMYSLIDGSVISKVKHAFIWVIYGVIVLLAGIKLNGI